MLLYEISSYLLHLFICKETLSYVCASAETVFKLSVTIPFYHGNSYFNLFRIRILYIYISYKSINSSNSGPTKLSATRKMTMGYMRLSKAQRVPQRNRQWASILGKGHSRRRRGTQMAMCEVLGWKLPGTGWLSRDGVPPSLIPAPDKDNRQIFHEIYLCESLNR